MQKKILLIVVLFMPLPAQAFYCGTRVISEGDALGRVEALCGPPTSVRHYVAYESFHGFTHHPHHRIHHGPYYRFMTPVTVEEWRYNFGPQRFIQRVVFVNGAVKKIESEGYGH
jgi:hypothetical protein